MTEKQFRELEEGTQLYDAKLSRRYGRHVTATAQGYDKVSGDLLMYSEGIEEQVSMADHLMWDIMPDDESSLPFC